MPDTMGEGASADSRYKIGEICRLADVQPYVLRYWENEFPVLAADRALQGPRLYSERDLQIIQRIKTLLYVEGFTIAGAKKRLDNELRVGERRSRESSADSLPLIPPPLPSAVPPPVPAEAAPEGDAKPKKAKTRSDKVPARKETEADLPEIFEESMTEPAAPGAASGSKQAPLEDHRTGVVAQQRQPQQRPDPRLARVVAELKEILTLLGN